MVFVISIFLTLLLWNRTAVRSFVIPDPTMPIANWYNSHKVCMAKRAQVANGYTVVEHSAFKLNSTALTWNKAREACVSEGGHLAVADTVAERNFMQELSQRTSGKFAFVGLHDLYEEGVWVSVLDEPLRWDLYGWGPYHAKETNLKSQNCARIGKGYLDDYYCFKPLPFICEISLEQCQPSLFKL